MLKMTGCVSYSVPMRPVRGNVARRLSCIDAFQVKSSQDPKLNPRGTESSEREGRPETCPVRGGLGATRGALYEVYTC